MIKKRKADPWLICCVFCALIAAGMTFGYFIIQEKGFFTVVADFNSQQLTFATAVWNMLHSGNAGEWIWNIDLGSSFVNTFSFYNLGSPFYWISLLFPRGSFPYLAGFLYILKYVVAGMTAYLYLRLFAEDRRYAVIGALLYAFSGFQTTNLEFFHFHDVTAVFPLMLLGLELSMKDKRRQPAFVFAIFLNCLINYFFFIQEVIFLVVYYLVRYHGLGWKEFLKGIANCLLCGILGVGMASILFIPAVLYLLGNARSQMVMYLQNFAYDSRGLLHILKGLLFPGEPMDSLSVLKERNWDSTSAYLPLFGLSLVFAYLDREKNWLRRLLLILGVMALSPILESVFLLFAQIYQRWWYMFVMMMALATMKVAESPEKYRMTRGCLLYIVILTAFYFLVRYMPWNSKGESVVYHELRFLFFYLIALSGPVILILLKKLRRFCYRPLLGLTMVSCVLTTSITLYFYRQGTNVERYRQEYTAGLQMQAISDQYRYNSTLNVFIIPGNASGIGVFCTTIENSSREFDLLFGHNSTNRTIKKDDIPGLAQLLGGKYNILEEPGDSMVVDQVSAEGKEYYITESDACPIGFSVDFYLTSEELMALPAEQRAMTLMTAAVIEENDLEKASDAVSKLNPDSLDFSSGPEAFIPRTTENAVSDFSRDSSGFACRTNWMENRLVYFTVPYSEGWHASIDGESAEIINSGGMMALAIPGGDHEVTFVYHTPGLRAGVAVSVISFALFAAVVIRNHCAWKKEKNNPASAVKLEKIGDNGRM